MALIVGAIVNMTSTLPTQADHNKGVLQAFTLEAYGTDGNLTGTTTSLLSTDGNSPTWVDDGEDACHVSGTGTGATAVNYSDTTCAITYATDVSQIQLRATPGSDADHTTADTTNYVTQIGGVSIPQTGTPTGNKIPLEYGSNVILVDVVRAGHPAYTQQYTLTVTRTPNSTPTFVAGSGKNDRFKYGYAQNEMIKKSVAKAGTESKYDHPSDGVVYAGDDGQTYYAKNNTTKYFVRGDVFSTNTAEFTATTGDNVLSFTAVIQKGDGSAAAKDTDALTNLSGGITIQAGQDLGTIRLPWATGGNGWIQDYELVMLGPDGNAQTNTLPVGLTATYVTWTDNASDTNTANVGVIDAGDTFGSGNAIDNTSDANANADGTIVGIQLATISPNHAQTASGGAAEKSVYHMIYRAVDSDANTKMGDGGDAAEIDFTITIQKGLVDSTDPTDPAAPDANELSNLVVASVTTAVTDSTKTPREAFTREMTPKFDSDETDYRVTIPYEAKAVDITATAVTGSVLKKLNQSGTSPTILASGDSFRVSELVAGQSVDVNIEVTPPASSGLSKQTYTIEVFRQDNGRAQFDASEKPASLLNFYDRVKIEPIGLPGGREGFGNGDPTPVWDAVADNRKPDGEWRYDLSLESAYTGHTTSGPGHPYDSENSDAYTNGLRSQVTTWLPASTPAFAFSTTWSGTGDDATVKRQLTGTPNLGTQATGIGRSKYSDYNMVYVAKDGDLDDSKSDNVEYKFTIRVWRNVLLETLEVDITPDTAGISPSGMVFDRSDAATDQAILDKYSEWNADRKYEYSFTVDHDVDQISVKGTVMENVGITNDAVAVASPDDADTDTEDIHEINLVDGDNKIVIEVTNGENVGTHELTVYRRPLGANPITVTTVAGKETVKLTPEFHVATLEYSGTVESHQDSVEVKVAVTHPQAQVRIADYLARNRSRVMEVDTGENRYRVDVTLGSATTTYFLNITRKDNEVPSFGSATVPDDTRQVGKMLKTCNLSDGSSVDYIQLPAAVEGSGNGALRYSIADGTLPRGVSFNSLTRKLTGTPLLVEAYERSYDIAYVVSDSDDKTGADDTDTINFTLTITHKELSDCGAPGGIAPTPRNLLTNLLVIYDLPALNKTDVDATLTPEFAPTTEAYNVELPYGSTNRRVAAYVQAGATVSLNKGRISSGVYSPIGERDANTVRVSAPGLNSTTYNLMITEAAQSIPVLAGAVPDQTFQAGKPIASFQLPVASGGNPPLTYTLVDHQDKLPKGLDFDPETRILSGTPVLSSVDSAETALYQMTYTVTDRDGDPDTDMFNITVQIDPVDVPNTGVAPMDLKVSRSGTNATVSWNAGDAAISQIAVAVKTDATGLQWQLLDAGVESARFTGLETGMYLFLVIGVDANGDSDYDSTVTQ